MKTFKASEAYLERARKTIPLGSQTFSKSLTQYPFGASPYFIQRGKGSHVWDVDGNEYIDFVSSLASITLGYSDPTVDAAVRAQLEEGVIFSLPHPIEAEVAELICDLVPCADMVRFGKNGSDATAGAIRLARAFTHRDRVAVCGYHGWQDWYIGSTARHRGVPKATRELTHNFTFFRQVRNWYYNLPGQKKTDVTLRPARFYMLATEFVAGRRTARLDLLDPFLHQYESEYHYLFKRVHEEAHKPAVQGLEAYYAIPNIARRLLEAFLAFRVPDKPGELYQKLEGVQYDAAKKIRILRFLHTYSHFDQVSEPDNDLSALSETPAILQEVLALIRHCDPAHFKSMTDLISPPAAPPVGTAPAALA